MSEKKNFVEKVLRTVALATSETSSWIGFYEPKMPEKLIKAEKKKTGSQIKYEDV
ncbi:MAG: cyclic lactone autoinducer peptide [Eubacterium sp.]